MTHTTNHTSVCQNRVAIIIAGIVFLIIFVLNIAMLSYCWSIIQGKQKLNNLKQKSKTGNQDSIRTWNWYPYAIVIMIGVICTALYVHFYFNCDAVAALVLLLLPLLATVASALQWPAYSLNPLAFGFEVAMDTRRTQIT